ncbi:MAG: carboxypeptidase regulatory-like domain-containing protein [Planctomycetes bacterium]|nr:carboxypeptidase regulatory-like domain-containing protein [Planctomycetota bacterium]
MKKGWLGVSALVVGIACALGLFAYVLDHARASVRVVRGLGEAAEPEREQALAVPEEVEDELEPSASSRRSAARAPERENALEVRVVDPHGAGVSFVEVLAYRGGELVRASEHMRSVKALIPFDGAATLVAERDGLELARLDVPDGHGRYELVVPELASVAGVVRVAGVPRAGVDICLEPGGELGLAAWAAYAFEQVGLRDRHGTFSTRSDGQGRFCIEGLPPGWAGVLHLDPGYRLASGARSLALARPDGALELELVRLVPEREVRGRVVAAGEPLREASWNLGGSWGACDELGRFSVHVPAKEFADTTLELRAPALAARRFALDAFGEGSGPLDLGDVELAPARSVALSVRDEAGAPLAGAVACVRSEERPDRRPTRSVEFVERISIVQPTDAQGRATIKLPTGARALVVRARGYAPAEVALAEQGDAPLAVVLTRAAALEVRLRDAHGRVPPGLRVRTTRGRPFLWANGFFADRDECAPILWNEGSGQASREGVELGCERGRCWFEPLRAGEPFALALADAYGTELDAREFVLEPGEWRRIDFRVGTAPRTLLIVVRDSLGRPLAGAGLALAPPGAPAPRPQLYTDRAGMARTEPFYAERVTLCVTRRGFESRTLERLSVPPEGATLGVRLAHDWFAW